MHFDKKILSFVLIFLIVLNCSICVFAVSPTHQSPIITIEEVSKENNNYFHASYVYVDIQFENIHDLQIYKDKGTIKQLVEKSNAIFAINGVFWNHNNENKHLVYNGELVVPLTGESIRDYCIIYDDGSMITVPYAEITCAEDFPENEVWQILTFGPILLHNSKEVESYEDTYNKENLHDYSHPRTAIGYFEPNHFCFLIVAGRNTDDYGAYFEDMARFFKDKGCIEAYNLDGGGSSHIWYNGKEYGHPSEDRVLPEILYIAK